MIDPKYGVGDKVEAQSTGGVWLPASIRGIKYTYTVAFNERGFTYERTEDQIRPQRPSPEEAWEKSTLLIGMRWGQRGYGTKDYLDEFNKETRHQCYQILGSAGIKITDKVKADVRRLIEAADNI